LPSLGREANQPINLQRVRIIGAGHDYYAAADRLLLADCCPSRTAEIGQKQPLNRSLKKLIFNYGIKSLEI